MQDIQYIEPTVPTFFFRYFLLVNVNFSLEPFVSTKRICQLPKTVKLIGKFVTP